MKKAIKALWHGIKAVFTAVVDGVATLFGMKDDSKYSRNLRRLVSAAFTIVVMIWALYALVGFGSSIYRNVRYTFHSSSEEEYFYFVEQLSDDLNYYMNYSDEKGYLSNAKGKKVLEHVAWISKPLEGDSLVCYNDGVRRGYFHMRDGRVVIAPQYRHAWIFSEGMAAVEQDGRVKFIDTEGRRIIDGNFSYQRSHDGYVFHRGHCAVNDSAGEHMGLIDRRGQWVLPPVYDEIVPRDTFWIVTQGDRQAVLSFGMGTVLPITDASFYIRDTYIKAEFNDHTVSTYTLQGELIAARQIFDVEQMMFYTREVVYPDYDSEEVSYTSEEPYTRKAVATCWRYEAEIGWYGLMSPTGKIITPPCYVRIEAVDKDLYLCESSNGQGVLLNSRGQRVE